jgi:hypothetical protein
VKQEDEAVQYVLVNCVLSRKVWFRILSLVGLQHCTSNPTDMVFQEWWSTTTHSESPNSTGTALIPWSPWWL